MKPEIEYVEVVTEFKEHGITFYVGQTLTGQIISGWTEEPVFMFNVITDEGERIKITIPFSSKKIIPLFEGLVLR